MKPNKKTITHAIICTIILLVAMMLFVSLNYIDFSVVRVIYLPIYAVAMAALVFRQYLFGYIFTTSAALGLTIEYITHLSRENPTMTGAFLNTLIILSGFIIGITAEIIFTLVKKNREP